VSTHATPGLREDHLAGGQYFGAVAERRRSAGLTLSDVRHEHGRRLPEHTHERAFFCLLLAGGYTERVGRTTESFGPFSVLFHPPAHGHQDEIGRTGGRFFSVELDAEWIDRAREIAPRLTSVSQPRGGELVWLAMRLFRELRARDPISDLVVEGLVLEMLACAARTTSPRAREARPWLDRATEMVRDSTARHRTISEIAREAGVHPVHLARVFREAHGCTVGEYVQRSRIQSALQMLATTDLPLVDVALATGFADQSHFTRVFRKALGSPPGAFRTIFDRTLA
jgi:AraC family transcriptional regulator